MYHDSGFQFMANNRLGNTDAVAQAAFNDKKWIWVEDAKDGYLAGWITNDNSDTVEVRVNNGSEVRIVKSDQLSKMNPPKFDYAEDVADLTYLNDASVVHNLRLRYHSNMIYTYSGLFLVAINPYRPLPIYTDQVIASYKHKKRHEAPPHIFALTDASYNDMLVDHENQSILVTGESGAGKTENTKKVIQYLAAIASDARGTTDLGLLERQILQANPILESFGNAQTIRNNNSSRFGKFVRIQFNQSGQIAGANIDWYLLEKSRVIHQSSKERNYHIFYQLFKGGDNTLKSRLLLDGNLSDYKYLKNSRKDIDGVDDVEEFKSLIDSLTIVGFTRDEQSDLFRVVAAILHMGNLEIESDREDQARLPNVSLAERLCHVLGIPVSEFTRALLRPRVKAGHEMVTQHRTKLQVLHSMDALAKTMYERSFGSLVDRINRALERSTSKSNFIGVLDIAGFEIFEVNSFEQLNINYTNEKLQQFFNHHMFILEQEEYARENIEWTYHDFGQDLRPTIDLIELSNPIGILSCLDEECVMPKASDKTFIEKLNGIWSGKSSKFEARKFEQGFILQHYAGSVEYDTTGWLEKNKDPLNDNITKLLAQSSEPYIAALFADFAEHENPVAQRYNNSNDTLDNSSPIAAGRQQKSRVKKGAFRTVAQRHKEQLNLLMQQLSRTQPHFVRCILPNNEKKAGKIDTPLVLEQLRCNGVLEGIRIARKGYPNRLPFAEFRHRYEILCGDIIPQGFMDGRQACQKMVDYLKTDTKLFQIGTSKIFFKAGVLADLEEKRDECLTGMMSRFNASIRGYLTRRRTRKQLFRQQATKIIQKNARVYLELKQWEWWQLYTKVKPLLSATRIEESIRVREAKIQELQQQLKSSEEEKEGLYLKQISLERDRAKIEEELVQERQTAQDKEEILRRTLERCAGLMEELHESVEERDEMEVQLDNALAQVAAHRQQSAELHHALSIMQDALPQVENERSALKEREMRLISEKEVAEKRASCFADELASFQKENDILRNQHNDLNSEHKLTISRIQMALDETEKKYSKIVVEYESLQSEISDLEAELKKHKERLTEQLKIDDERNRVLHEQDDKLTSLSKQVVLEVSGRELAETKIKGITSEMDKLERELASERAERIRLQEAKVTNEAEINKLKAITMEIDVLRRTIETERAARIRAQEAKVTSETEVNKLKAIIKKNFEEEQAEKVQKLAEAQNGQLMKQFALLQSEFDKLQMVSQNDAKELREARDKAKKEVEMYKQTTSKLLAEARALRSAEQEAQIHASNSERARVKLELEVQTLRLKQSDSGSMGNIRQEIDKLERLLSTATMKTEILEDKLAKSERNNTELVTEIGTLREKFDTSKLELVKELESTNATLSKEMAAKAELIKANRRLQVDLKSMFSSRRDTFFLEKGELPAK